MAATVIYSADTQNDVGENELGKREALGLSEDWYTEVRVLRKDPTVALARAILAAPIISNEWRVEGSDKKQVDLLKKVILPMREEFMRDAVYSCIDYGWHAWEIRPQDVNGTKYLRKKSLRHELTNILIDNAGFPKGVRNRSYYNAAEEIDIYAPNVAFVSAAGEYDSPLGYPLMKNLEETLQSAEDVEETVSRYIKKVAGSHWALWYPEGVSMIDGEVVPNETIAKNILDSLKSNAKVGMPVPQNDFVEMENGTNSSNAKASAWRLELIESKSSGMDPFLDRQRYLDALKMRGLLVPERTAVEGQFGTKAEASEHGDVGLAAIEQWSHDIIEKFNSPYGVVGVALALNNMEWYPGSAYIVPLPIADDDKAFLREIFRTIVNNIKDYSQVIDLKKMGDRTNVPVMKNPTEVKNEVPDPETDVQPQEGRD